MSAVRAVLLDVSGVLYSGETAVPGAHDAIERLRAAGLPFRLVTNTTRRPKQALIEHLHALGFPIDPDDMITGTEALVDHLKTARLTPFTLVHPALDADFAPLTAGTPDAVVIGDAADRFTYERLNEAFRLLMAGAPLLAIANNRYFRDTDGLALDAGPFVAALEYAAGVRAEVFGKPAPRFFHSVVARLGVQPADAVMIGDDVDADVNGALACGLGATLVRTGKYRPQDDARVAPGGTIADDLLAAVETLTGPARPDG